MRGHVEFEHPRNLIFETNNTKCNVEYTSFSFYSEKGMPSRICLNIYNGENLLLMGRFEEKISLLLTGRLADYEFFHKFIFTSKMFTYINYDDIFKVSRVSREVRAK